jgi:hypothetical protein
MTTPVPDGADNYLQVMRERGWTFGDLADDLARQSRQPALDGGTGYAQLERWARTEQAAADLRAAASPDVRPEDAPPPVDPQRAPTPRTVTPPKKRTA